MYRNKKFERAENLSLYIYIYICIYIYIYGSFSFVQVSNFRRVKLGKGPLCIVFGGEDDFGKERLVERDNFTVLRGGVLQSRSTRGTTKRKVSGFRVDYSLRISGTWMHSCGARGPRRAPSRLNQA